MLIVITPFEILNKNHHERLLRMAPYIDGVLLRTPMPEKDLIGWIEHVIAQGFPKEKLIIHSNTTLAQILNVKRIHFREFQIPNDFSPLGWHVSMSVHSEKAIHYAIKRGVAWGLYGHLFQSDSKPGLSPRTKKEVVNALHTPLPLVAVGGIDSTTVVNVPHHFIGIAMIRAAFHQDLSHIINIANQWLTRRR
ncbi:thiamine phosphate synthase [Staphylococcus hyicus]|uniref:thiamine phosphate synthase n=1 Tax=Staphylococcus hyicus TaxID=1284 RepID=UPI002739D6CC|nr:thiamine phosphate synthase [Staphylococcus hyicus]MDP4448880.1 thiamine phosphate synthase [Staphylococcus hyicus]